MAHVIITLKIMPDSPEVDLAAVEEQAKKQIQGFAGKTESKTEQEPIAFGLKALKMTFVMDESKGPTDALEEKIRAIEGVNSVEVVDVRRAVG
jgi:elongation factor 1-beta